MTHPTSNPVSQESREINRAMQVLESYGVSPARAGTIHNGIEVLMTRMHRESVAHVAEIERLRAALRALMRGYVSTLESARDRILFYGGQCDSLDVMERGDPFLRSAREALVGSPGETCAESSVAWLIEWPRDDNMPARWWHPQNGWMLDANKAARFTRQQDAEAFIKSGCFGRPIVATEHAWILGVLAKNGTRAETVALTPGSLDGLIAEADKYILPVDVKMGAATFRRGVKVGTMLRGLRTHAERQIADAWRERTAASAGEPHGDEPCHPDANCSICSEKNGGTGS